MSLTSGLSTDFGIISALTSPLIEVWPRSNDPAYPPPLPRPSIHFSHLWSVLGTTTLMRQFYSQLRLLLVENDRIYHFRCSFRGLFGVSLLQREFWDF